MSAPQRYKDREDWSVEDILVHRRTGQKPVSDEYRQARRKALEAAGLEPDDAAPTAREDMTMEQLEALSPAAHAAAKYGTERNTQ